MAIFKEVLPLDIKTSRSQLNQLVDVLQDDISEDPSRRKYQSFVTGGLGPGVTSSLYQTVYDQDFTLSTASPVFDMTVGIFRESFTVTGSILGVDSFGKELFPPESMMMREKLDIYRQYAQTLLGDPSAQFFAGFGSSTPTDGIDEAVFVSFKRLFSRDQIKRDTIALRIFEGADMTSPNLSTFDSTTQTGFIYTDIGSSGNKLMSFGGNVGNLISSVDPSKTVGLVFYDRGTIVLDAKKVFTPDQVVSGTIDVVTDASGQGQFSGHLISDDFNAQASFFVNASIDDIVDHLARTRFGDLPNSAITFQNITNINSTLVFCRAAADEFNYSSNPTYTDDEDRIVVIDPGQEDQQKSFSYITSIGLYDANDNLLAVAKTSRPIEKSSERDLTLRVRLDF